MPPAWHLTLARVAADNGAELEAALEVPGLIALKRKVVTADACCCFRTFTVIATSCTKASRLAFLACNCMRRLRIRSSSHPARFGLTDSEIFDVSRRARSGARRRKSAMLSGPSSFRLRAASFWNVTSRSRWSAFRVARFAPTMAGRTWGAGGHDRADQRVSDRTCCLVRV